MKFTISRKLENLFSVTADNYTQAAIKAAHKLYGVKATARRTTGDTGKSGYFQAYEPMPRGQRGLNSVGEPFHVQ
jgi:hypothetical protein